MEELWWIRRFVVRCSGEEKEQSQSCSIRQQKQRKSWSFFFNNARGDTWFLLFNESRTTPDTLQDHKDFSSTVLARWNKHKVVQAQYLERRRLSLYYCDTTGIVSTKRITTPQIRQITTHTTLHYTTLHYTHITIPSLSNSSNHRWGKDKGEDKGEGEGAEEGEGQGERKKQTDPNNELELIVELVRTYYNMHYLSLSLSFLLSFNKHSSSILMIS